jgi:hypothetical protein
MSLGVLFTVLGLFVVGYAGWYVPRALGRASARRQARGVDSVPIDELLASRRWRNVRGFALVVGATMVLLGAVFLALGE